ncbi:MAG: hypothetical protein HQK53_11835, partial [Oligoflexia bacterium]|nr:hypothetical protein [Oligoflexia bacterium]
MQILLSKDEIKISELVNSVIEDNGYLPDFQVATFISLLKDLGKYLHENEGLDIDSLERQIHEIASE